MYRIVILSLIILLTTVSKSTSQTKFEREYRINKAQAPASALAFIHKVFPNQKVKWYTEESQQGISYEAKTIYKKELYSIEFDTLGGIQDIEKKVSVKKLDVSIQNKIFNTLSSQFQKYYIRKLQIQWKAENSVLSELIKTGKATETYQLKYEIVLRGKKENSYKSYEALLDNKGNLVSILEITTRNDDNLQF